MSVMDKFATVEIKSDNRITNADKAFCSQQQCAYDKASKYLREMLELSTSAIDVEKNLTDGKVQYYGELYKCDFDSYLQTRNHVFIECIVKYFARTYKVTLDENIIMKRILPREPDDKAVQFHPLFEKKQWTDEEWKAYDAEVEAYSAAKNAYIQALKDLSLRYEDIVDEIFLQMEGYSFLERGVNEMLANTYNCSHNGYNDTPMFELKNNALKLTSNCWCHYPCFACNEFEPNQRLLTLVDALAWFENGKLGAGYELINGLFKYYHTPDNIFELEGTTKVKSLKMLKNGNAEVRFHSPIYAQEFVDTCMKHTA